MGLHTFLFSLLVFHFPGPDTAEYRKYERDNVSIVRKAFDFEYPVLNAASPEIRPVQNQAKGYSFGPEDTLRVTWDVSWNLEQLRNLHSPDGEVKLDGFRVQLYAGGSYENCNKVKADFILTYPETRVYSTWIVPHFRVRAGDFLDHNDALKFMNRIKDKFPGAFVVPDKIEIHKKIHRDSPGDDGDG